ncbi:MAG: cytochrome P450 [Rhodobacteraceae bacterium]|nr:cytochrome P450 [Paracoccaceae bacterium]
MSGSTAQLDAPQPTGLNGAIPRLDGGLPLVGHLRRFQRDPISMLVDGAMEHGDLFRFNVGPLKFVLFSGLEAHDFYFRASDDELNAKACYQFTVPIFGRGVAYDATPQIFAEQLKFLYPALNRRAMERFARIMYDESRVFADSLGHEGELDLPHEMNELTVKIASRCLIGQEVRDRVDTGFAEAYHELQNGINTIGFIFPKLPTPGHRRRDRARNQIGDIFSEIMASRRRNGSEEEDFMQTLMEAQYSDGRSVPDDEVIGLLITSLFAGQHTSAVLATWMGLEIFRSAETLQQVRDEMRAVYVDSGTMSFENLQQQSDMENVVRECERLHPPLIILIRKVLEPLVYKGKEIPAGSLAMVAPGASHRLPHIFADPNRFNPNRFARPNSELDQHHYALIGFGGGKHACMGKNFAIMQLKAIWSVLLDRFEFEPLSSFPSPNYGSWVTGPTLPVRIKYRRRTQPTVFES